MFYKTIKSQSRSNSHMLDISLYSRFLMGRKTFYNNFFWVIELYKHRRNSYLKIDDQTDHLHVSIKVEKQFYVVKLDTFLLSYI